MRSNRANLFDCLDTVIGEGMVRFLALALLVSVFLITGCESPEDRAKGYLDSAQILYEEGDLVKAEIEVKNTLQIQPKNPQGRFLLATIHESRGEFQEMAANLRIAVESDPNFAEARVKLATIYILAGATDLAIEQAELILGDDRERADAKILFARIEASQGDLEAAREFLEEALEIEPSNTQALGLLASVSATTDLPGALALIDKGIADSDDPRPLRLLRIQLLQQSGARPADVEAGYRSLMKDYPEEPAYGYQLARFLASQGQVDAVQPVLETIIANDPENIDARLALTQFVASTQGPQIAVELLRGYANDLPEAYNLRLTLARLYGALGETENALAEYEDIVALAGNEDAGLTAQTKIAGIKLSAGEKEEGEALIEDVLAVDSMNSDALLLRAALNIDNEEFRAAVSDLRNILRNDPENGQAQLLLARAHSEAGDLILAEDAYRRVLSIDPGNALASLELARLLVGRDKLDNAEDVLRNRLEQAPQDVRATRLLIGILVSQKQFDAAEKEARRIIAIPGQEGVGNYLLGGVFQSRENYEQAVAAFRESLKFAPGAREPLQGLVASLVRLDRFDEAVADLERIQAENPENLYAKTLQGQLLASRGDAGAAEALFESTLAENESWLPAYTALAGLQGGDVSAQIDIYKRGLEAVPNSQELVLLLGTAYERNGQIDDAIASYEEALRANPNLPAVANNLAALLADHRSDKASFERALELAQQFNESDNPAFVDTLGWAHYRLGDYSTAIPLLEKAVNSAEKVPVLRYHLGMAYLADGQGEKAKEQLEVAVADENAVFTGVEEARAALKEL